MTSLWKLTKLLTIMLSWPKQWKSQVNWRGYCVKAHRDYAVLRYEGALFTLPEDFDSQYNPSERCNSTKQCYAINCPFMNYPENVFTTCINFDQLELNNRLPVPSNDVAVCVSQHTIASLRVRAQKRLFCLRATESQTEQKL